MENQTGEQSMQLVLDYLDFNDEDGRRHVYMPKLQCVLPVRDDQDLQNVVSFVFGDTIKFWNETKQLAERIKFCGLSATLTKDEKINAEKNFTISLDFLSKNFRRGEYTMQVFL